MREKASRTKLEIKKINKKFEKEQRREIVWRLKRYEQGEGNKWSKGKRKTKEKDTSTGKAIMNFKEGRVMREKEVEPKKKR